jgi:hypothetical protein
MHGHVVSKDVCVTDASGTTITTFRTLRYGLGSFLLTPAAGGGTYTASVRLPGGAVITSKLPVVTEQGYSLLLTDTSPTQLTVAVQAKPARSAQPLQLLAHTGQQVTAATEAALVNGQGQRFKSTNSCYGRASRISRYSAAGSR